MSAPGPRVSSPGFADPVFDSQGTFRAVLEAMANPGTLARIDHRLTPPEPLSVAAASLALTLLDHDTSVWIDSPGTGTGVEDYLAFHCGCPVVRDPGKADFALVCEAASMPPLAGFAQGDDRYPDESATVIIEVRGFRTGPPLLLRGPGIPSSRTVAPEGLPDDFAAWMVLNRAGFPLGVDVILTCGTVMTGLPRSVSVEA